MNIDRSIRPLDLDGLAIVDTVKQYHTQLTADVGSIGNICLVFMHDLVVHFSGILIQRAALEHYPDKVVFPYVDKHYAISPYEIGAGSFRIAESQIGLKSWLRRLELSRTALGEALPFGYRHDRLAAKVVNLLGSHKPFTRVYLPRRDEQIRVLCDLVMQLCRTFEIPGSDIVWRNWQQYVMQHTIANQFTIHDRGLLLGTRNNLQNRKLAVNYLQQNKEVVAVTHGEVANSVMDEPPFGYSERTLCSTLIDYGNFDQDGTYNAPLVRPQQRLYRNAPLAQALHRPSEHIELPGRNRCKALYIPTTYSGNGLYGPFHIYEDTKYRRWQRGLFAGFVGLTFKAHPKSRSIPLSGVPVDKRRLEDCIGDYDLLVFDYFATGSMLALVSDKPVIYFDIDLRRLHPQFMQDLKNRCEYVKIDLAGPLKQQVDSALTQFWSAGTVRSSAAITRYSLYSQNSFSWVALFRALNRGDPLT